MYLDVIMPMYNFLEYSKNYKKSTGSLWNYYRDEPSNSLSSNSQSFEYKTSITGNTYNADANKVGENETEVVVTLNLDILLINCEIELILTWSKNCVLAVMTTRAAGNDNNPPAIVALTGLEFQIKYAQLYVPVVTLSERNDNKLLEQLKSEFKRNIKWNKYMSKRTI